MLRKIAGRFWAWLRAVTGDDAYDAYARHWRAAHEGPPPLDRKAFFRARQQEQWDGIRRCC